MPATAPSFHPSLMQCFFCLEPCGVAVQRRATITPICPEKAVHDLTPCDTCAGYMKEGIILISVRDGEPQTLNPHRTGAFIVIKEEAARRLFKPPGHPVFKHRWAFVEDHVWDLLNFPRGSVPQPTQPPPAGA